MTKSAVTTTDSFLLHWMLFGALFGFAGIAFIAVQNFGISSEKIFAPLWVGTYGILLFRWGICVPHRWILVFLALSFISSWLSYYPEIAFRYWWQLLGSLVVFSVAARRFSLAEIVSALRRTISLMLIWSLILYAFKVEGSFVANDLARENWLGLPPIAGIFSHKINLAIGAAILLIFCVFTEGPKRLLQAVLAVFCLSLTESVGVFLVLGGLLPFGFLLRFLINRFGFRSTLYLPGIVGLFLVLSILFLPNLAQQLGRDWDGLTGRWQIWETALLQVQNGRILGIGYEVATRDPSFKHAFGIAFSHRYLPPHLHSSYIQHIVNVGVLGALSFLVMLTIALCRGAIQSFHGNSNAVFATWLVMIFFALLGLVEHVFGQNQIGLFWLVLSLERFHSIPDQSRNVSKRLPTNQNRKFA
jgi:O-antigen ligase